MEFKDFKDNPEELIGHYVLCMTPYAQYIKPIIRVTKSAFKISGDKDFYNLSNGWKCNDGWIRTSCTLLTDEEALKLKEEWDITGQIKQLKKNILTNIDELSFDQLKNIQKILDIKEKE